MFHSLLCVYIYVNKIDIAAIKFHSDLITHSELASQAGTQEVMLSGLENMFSAPPGLENLRRASHGLSMLKPTSNITMNISGSCQPR